MKHSFLAMAAAVTLIAACDKGPVPVNFIFETDLGNDVDDALALDMIYKYQDQGLINLLGICINKEGTSPLEYIDILNTMYGYPDIPVGTVRNGADCYYDGVNYSRHVSDFKDDNGKPLYERSKSGYECCTDAHILYRKLLASQKDNSVVIASVGFSTNLARLLDTPADEYSDLTGKELIAKKVKQLVMMAGCICEEQQEYNVMRDVPAAQKVLAEWPGVIVVSPFELGLKTIYPYEKVEENFSWAEKHPIAEAFKDYHSDGSDSPLWDLTAVLYAVEGGKWFDISPVGNITVTDEGFTLYEENPRGNTYYLSVDTPQAEAIVNRIYELNTALPACR